MGSPVSAVVANLNMVAFEKRAIEPQHRNPRSGSAMFMTLSLSWIKTINSQQLSIRFTMEIGKDSEIAFLDTSGLTEPKGRLNTSVYRKLTRTDQYLTYNSHHPQSVKRGVVKCLYNRTKRLITKSSVISSEKNHLSSLFVSNGYPLSFVKRITKTRKFFSNKNPITNFSYFTVCERCIRASSSLLTTRRCLQFGHNC